MAQVFITEVMCTRTVYKRKAVAMKATVPPGKVRDELVRLILPSLQRYVALKAKP